MSQTKERLLHHVIISVFCKPYDSKEAVLHGLDTLSPVPTAELLAQDPQYDEEQARTVHHTLGDTTLTVHKTESDEGEMIVYTLFFKKMSAVNQFAHQLVECMTKDEKEEYAHDPEKLLDYEGKISLRLDKELLMQGKLSITQEGDCYQIKASVAAYPKNKEKIIEVIKNIITQ